MVQRTPGLAVILAGLMLAPCPGLADSYDIDASLTERGKWKSFGVEDWAVFNPHERALPARVSVSLTDWSRPSDMTSVGQLKALIAFAEAGRQGYNAVHHSAGIKPPKKPTALTLGQIKAWIRATPGQAHAIGRYQFIPSTLAGLVRRANLPDSTVFSPAVQDLLADYLLVDAGINRFLAGKLSRKSFMNNLARIWAGLPLSNGKSAYHGYAGNRATVTLAFYQHEMAEIFGK